MILRDAGQIDNTLHFANVVSMIVSNSERMIRLRNRLGLTQRELAKEFRVSSGAIGFWETGTRPIPGPVMKLIEAFEHHLGENNAEELDRTRIDAMSREWVAEFLASLRQGKSRKDSASLHKTFSGMLSRYLRDHLSNDPIQRGVQWATYARLFRELENAKGLPLKIIELASYLDPAVPTELRDCLGLLQNRITAMPPNLASRLIYEEFGRRPSEVFAEWSPKPIAAASLGQVHRARLRSGEWVAVKIQYPRIREELARTFEDPVLSDMISVLIRSKSMEIIKEFQTRVLGECDYLDECERQENLARIFEAEPEIHVPRVFPAYCTSRILTTEFIDGIGYREFSHTATQAEKNRAAENLVRFQAISFYGHGAIHTDIHPGNLLFRPRQTVFIDFGRTLTLNRHETSQLAAMTISILKNEPAAAKKAAEGLGIVRDWTEFDFNEFWNLIREQHFHFWEDAPFQFNEAYISRKRQLMRSYRQKHLLKLNGPFFWNTFMVSTHDAIRADLRAKANWRKVILKAIHDSGYGI